MKISGRPIFLLFFQFFFSSFCQMKYWNNSHNVNIYPANLYTRPKSHVQIKIPVKIQIYDCMDFPQIGNRFNFLIICIIFFKGWKWAANVKIDHNSWLVKNYAWIHSLLCTNAERKQSWKLEYIINELMRIKARVWYEKRPIKMNE